MSTDSDIPRLQDADGNEIEQRLLASAAEDVIAPEKLRALVEWSAGVGTAGSAPARGSWKPVVAKGAGVFVLAAAAAGVFALASSSAPADAPVTNVQAIGTVEAPMAPAAPPETVTPDQLPPAPPAASAPSPRALAKRPVNVDTNPSLGEQMAFIDDARTRIRRGDPRAALAVLDDYDRRYAQQAFKEEATVLRVSALAKAGDVEGAQKLGKAFLSTHPAELYSRRVETLLRGLEPKEARP